jgi:hypothetical protein
MMLVHNRVCLDPHVSWKHTKPLYLNIIRQTQVNNTYFNFQNICLLCLSSCRPGEGVRIVYNATNLYLYDTRIQILDFQNMRISYQAHELYG